jgi:hypothetical protein
MKAPTAEQLRNCVPDNPNAKKMLVNYVKRG